MGSFAEILGENAILRLILEKIKRNPGSMVRNSGLLPLTKLIMCATMEVEGVFILSIWELYNQSVLFL